MTEDANEGEHLAVFIGGGWMRLTEQSHVASKLSNKNIHNLIHRSYVEKLRRYDVKIYISTTYNRKMSDHEDFS